jgi:hypothetical protein
MLGVKEISGQCWNVMVFGESSQGSHSFVEILLLYVLFRHLRRIFQARVCPKFGNMMLKRLDTPLQKK